MKHLGKQEFTNITVSDKATIDKTIITDTLNIPLHRSINAPQYGDIFIESNALNITNQDNEVTTILDISNPDIIKALLMTELVHDDLYNLDNTSSQSFNTEIDLVNNFSQIDIDATLDCTSLLPNIQINFTDNLYADSIYNKLLQSKADKLPLRTTLTDNTISSDYMILYDNISYSSLNKTITVNLSSVSNSETLSDLTNYNPVKIIIKSFLLLNTTQQENYIALPNHYHRLKDISDLQSNTNTNNGYLKLNDSTLSLLDDWRLNVTDVGINNSFLTQNHRTNIINSNVAYIQLSGSPIATLSYTDSTIDILNEEPIIEYTFTQLQFNINETIELTTNSSYYNKMQKQLSVTDTTAYANSYLVQKLKIDFSELITLENHGVIDFYNVTYELIPKSSIDSTNLALLSLEGTVITTINKYYDITVTQPNSSVVPFITYQTVNLYADDDGLLSILLPKQKQNLVGTKRYTLKSSAQCYFTTSTPTLEIYNYNCFTNTLNLIDNLTTTGLFTLPAGLIKFVPSTVGPYNLTFFGEDN